GPRLLAGVPAEWPDAGSDAGGCVFRAVLYLATEILRSGRTRCPAGVGPADGGRHLLCADRGVELGCRLAQPHFRAGTDHRIVRQTHRQIGGRQKQRGEHPTSYHWRTPVTYRRYADDLRAVCVVPAAGYCRQFRLEPAAGIYQSAFTAEPVSGVRG